jgi:hypothetical protein
MLKKPDVKSAGNSVVSLLAVGAGVKTADIVSAVAPQSTNKWKNWAMTLLGIGLAASVDTKKPNGDKAQLFFLGFAGKPLFNELTGIAKQNVSPEDPSTLKGKIMNALVGHNEVNTENEVAETAEDIMTRLANPSMDWSAREATNDMWSRFGAQEVSFTGV